MASSTSIASVTQDYQNILFGLSATGSGPVGDPEIAAWAAQIDAGQMTNAQVAAALAASPTAIDVVDPIIRLYKAAFGHAPDIAGLTYWVGQVGTGGLSLDQAAQAMVGSAEFAAEFGGSAPSAAALLSALYHNALGRDPDTAGQAYWTARLADGAATPASAVAAFAQSGECTAGSAGYIANWQVDYATTDDPASPAVGSAAPSAASLAAATRDFATILLGGSASGHGAASAAEIAAWAALIDSGTLSDAQVAGALTSSAAATTIVDPIIRLYQAAFGRAPDLAGLTYWAGQIESGALTLGQVAQALVGSAEFSARYAGSEQNHGVYVTALGLNALDHVPDAALLAAWTQGLDSGAMSAADVLLAVAATPEFVTASASAIAAWQSAYAATGSYSTTLGIGSNTPPPPPSAPTWATTFTLTTGTDSGIGFTGSPQDDTYNGTLVFSGGALDPGSTLTAGDSLDGAGGTDTLAITVSGGSVSPSYVAAPALAGIETVLVANGATDAAHAVTISLAAADGSLTTVGTTASVAGVTTSFTNLTSLAGAQMAGPGDLSVAYAAGVVSGGADGIGLTLNGVGTDAATPSTFTTSGIETVAITSDGGANSLKLVDGDLATVTIAGSQSLSLNLSNLTQGLTITDNSTSGGDTITVGNSNNTITDQGNGTSTIRLGTGLTTLTLGAHANDAITVGADAAYAGSPTVPNLVINGAHGGVSITLASISVIHIEYVPGLLGQAGSIAGTISNLEAALISNHPGASAFAIDIYGGDTFIVASASGVALGSTDTTIIRLVGYTGTVTWDGVDNVLRLH